MFTFERTPLTEAIAFFREKINIPTASWADLEEIEHTVAFTVAGLTAELLEEARQILDKLIIEGTSIQEARGRFNELMTDSGWLANASTKQRAWRIDTIIDTNLKTSNAIGRYAYQNDPDVIDAFPYYLNRHGDSVVPRPVHKKLDGIVYRRDDPRAAALYKPSGYRCSCLTFVISEREYLAKYKGTDKDYVTVDVPFTVMIDGIEQSTDADKGFKLAPAMPDSEQRDEIVKRMGDRLDPSIYDQFLQNTQEINREYTQDFSNQLRQPKGSSKGGQFAKKGGSGQISDIQSQIKDVGYRAETYAKISNQAQKSKNELEQAQSDLQNGYIKDREFNTVKTKAEADLKALDTAEKQRDLHFALKDKLNLQKLATRQAQKDLKAKSKKTISPDLPIEGSVNLIKDKRIARKLIFEERNKAYDLAEKHGLFDFPKKKSSGLTKKQEQDIVDNATIWGLLSAGSGESEYRVIQNSKGTQSVALFTEKFDHIYVDYLASASHNISGFENTKTSRGQSALTLAEVARESIARGKNGEVRLYALEGARGFYEKIGFEKMNNNGDYELSSKKAKALIDKYTKDVNVVQLSKDDDDELWELEQSAAGAFTIPKSEIDNWNNRV